MDFLRRSAIFTNCLYLVSAIILAVYNTKDYTEHEFDILDLITIHADKWSWLITSLLFAGGALTLGAFTIFYLGISHIQWKSIRTTHWPNLHRELFDELSPAGNSTWDELQRKYQCCGINGSADFLGSAWAAYEENLYNAVPRSCCKDENNFHKCEIEGLWSQIHQIGCQTVLSTALYELSCQTKIRLVVLSLGESLLFILCLLKIMIWKRGKEERSRKTTPRTS
ncbi:Oidioi.mRNA.OKI2018_I69.XSR.g16140.t2.cds [Oikopleura dioica]|uniref:Oidioi.mRNA.OKI2018_I69.XSR.g16140.t2.cds n=1 Tax=Oikopleura dioica TaxID=34765 RepID=A0ABN7SF60_OIKDI|nr:Oidioi.mRNA.OKI2018_I69.XSR.g16140.t2.cds [Oikopleura dioica]